MSEMDLDLSKKNFPRVGIVKKQSRRIAVLAPLGWCLRDWVLSRFLSTLTSGIEAIIFTPQANALRKTFDLSNVSFEWMEVQPLGRIQQDLARTIDYTHFYRLQTYIHRSVLTDPLSDWPWRARLRIQLLRVLARYLFKQFPTPWIEQTEQACLGLMAESKRVEQVLRNRRVDLVLSTMPLIGHYERPTLWAAQRLGIPAVCIITSWDNLFSKGRLPIRFSHYLVWSERMRDDLLAHYPDIPSNAITIVGAPKFDFYRQHDLLKDRAEFIRSIGGNPSRRLILWSGASINQMPNEPMVLEMFCEAAREGHLHGHPQILVRPHPIGGGARFMRIRERYPELLFTETNSTDPRYLIHWSPLVEDAALLVNSIAHCDVNINHCSTMTLDCCVLDRPVVNIAFDLVSGSEMEKRVRDCYSYDHYRSVLELGAVQMAYSLDTMITQVNNYLENAALDREGRAKLLRLQCGEVDGKAAERAAQCLLKLVDGSASKTAIAGGVL